ncbi:uncharacterized protein LOC142235888 [Haematobia irritans]|uniref:uncharacterized protein LOC142235888 n=1 Tax=Haematobia irritans TaxID=7368 RepID=UPI003F4F9481
MMMCAKASKETLVTNRTSNKMDAKRHLIEEVRSRPVLWNNKHEHHYSRQIVQDTWREVATLLNIDDVEECKNKWKNLRDTFRAMERRTQRRQGRDPGYESQWAYFEDLNFLNGDENRRKKRITANNSGGENSRDAFENLENKTQGIYDEIKAESKSLGGNDNSEKPRENNDGMISPQDKCSNQNLFQRNITSPEDQGGDNENISPIQDNGHYDDLSDQEIEDMLIDEFLGIAKATKKRGRNSQGANNIIKVEPPSSDNELREYAQYDNHTKQANDNKTKDNNNGNFHTKEDDHELITIKNENNVENDDIGIEEFQSIPAQISEESNPTPDTSHGIMRKQIPNNSIAKHSCPEKHVHFREENQIQKERSPTKVLTTSNTIRHSLDPRCGDPDFDFLVSFLPYMKKMNDFQNLRFRSRMCDMVLNTFDTFLNKNQPNLPTEKPSNQPKRQKLITERRECMAKYTLLCILGKCHFTTSIYNEGNLVIVDIPNKMDVRRRLIQEVRRRPALWHRKHQHRHTRAVVQEGWQEVAQILNMSVAVCKRKWRCILDILRYVQKREQNEPSYESSWPYYDDMSFISGKVRTRSRYKQSENFASGLSGNDSDARQEKHFEIIKVETAEVSGGGDNRDFDNELLTFADDEPSVVIENSDSDDVYVISDAEEFIEDNIDDLPFEKFLANETKYSARQRRHSNNHKISQIEKADLPTHYKTQNDDPVRGKKLPNNPTQGLTSNRTANSDAFTFSQRQSHMTTSNTNSPANCSSSERLSKVTYPPESLDADGEFLISFLPQMKKMSHLQNLQFRSRMSDLVLDIFKTNRRNNPPGLPSQRNLDVTNDSCMRYSRSSGNRNMVINDVTSTTGLDMK